MLTSLLLSVLTLGQIPATAGRYDLGERIKLLDRAWTSTADKGRRAVAVPRISKAWSLLQEHNLPEACRALDEATAAIEGRDPRSEDALTLRFDPPYAEPKTTALLRVGWAYQPRSFETIRIVVGHKSVVATPGRPLTLEVHPEAMNPELLLSPEAGYLVPVQVGDVQRGAYLSLIKRPRHRVSDLLAAKMPEAKEIAISLDRLMASTEAMDADVPIIQQLFTAELLEDGRLKLDRAEQLPLVRQGDTAFRVAFPKSLVAIGAPKRPVTVVIGLPEPGGSENMFFEAYGAGRAVSEALGRGWVFVSARAGAHSVQDCLDWLKTRRGLTVSRFFVLGHGDSSDLALSSTSLNSKPAGIALFAPSAQSLPNSAAGTPIYLAVGKQDASMLPNGRHLAGLLEGRPNFVMEELDPCEHLMVVGDALPMAYRFFEKLPG